MGWREQEKSIAKKQGGKVTPRSGAGYIKGDVISDIFFTEAKFRNSESSKGTFLTIEDNWFSTLLKNHKKSGGERTPLLNISIGDRVSYSIVPLEYWKDYCGAGYIDTEIIELGSQLRMYSTDEVEYKTLNTSSGMWVILPESEIRFIIRNTEVEIPEYKRKLTKKQEVFKKKIQQELKLKRQENAKRMKEARNARNNSTSY